MTYAAIIDALESDWRAQARPEQILPAGDWSYWMYLGGRGTGKTRSGAEGVKELVESGEARRIGLIGPTSADVRGTMLEGPSGLLSIYPDSSRPIFEPSKRQVTFANGAIATLFSSEEPDRLRGPNADFIWADEAAAWKDAENVWRLAMLGLRLGKRPRAIITTTPRPTKIIKNLLANPNTVVTRGTTYDNRANLAPSFFEQIIKEYEGTRYGRQELNAEILDDVPGALWSRDLIERTRCGPIAPLFLKRVVVGVDPAISVGADSNLTGIIVAGLGEDDHHYVLADLSGKLQPHEWGRRAIDATKTWFADRIVAEANQGGQMVEHVIRAIDKNASFRAVHASRGKITRAEPIAALFEQGRAHLAGAFPALEDQLCTFEPGAAGSPDRLDACVWALTELMTGGRRAELHFA